MTETTPNPENVSNEPTSSIELSTELQELKRAMLAKAQQFGVGQERQLENEIQELVRMHIK